MQRRTPSAQQNKGKSVRKHKNVMLKYYYYFYLINQITYKYFTILYTRMLIILDISVVC